MGPAVVRRCHAPPSDSHVWALLVSTSRARRASYAINERPALGPRPGATVDHVPLLASSDMMLLSTPLAAPPHSMIVPRTRSNHTAAVLRPGSVDEICVHVPFQHHVFATAPADTRQARTGSNASRASLRADGAPGTPSAGPAVHVVPSHSHVPLFEPPTITTLPRIGSNAIAARDVGGGDTVGVNSAQRVPSHTHVSLRSTPS